MTSLILMVFLKGVKMITRVLLVLLVSSFAIADKTFGNQNCNAAHGSYSGENERISRSGARFIKDSSIPALGEAHQDPTGLIWGSIIVANDIPCYMDYKQAIKFCHSLGVRLPSRGEYVILSAYLRGNDGYSPYLQDGITDFLQFRTLEFWSSEFAPPNADLPPFVYVFSSFDGSLRTSFLNGKSAVRCVSHPRAKSN